LDKREPSASEAALASGADVRALFGDIGDLVVAEILALRPTFAEVEEAAMRMDGETGAFAGIRPESGVVARIIELAHEDDSDAPSPAGRFSPA
jgi:hypothetical protein